MECNSRGFFFTVNWERSSSLKWWKNSSPFPCPQPIEGSSRVPLQISQQKLLQRVFCEVTSRTLIRRPELEVNFFLPKNMGLLDLFVQKFKSFLLQNFSACELSFDSPLFLSVSLGDVSHLRDTSRAVARWIASIFGFIEHWPIFWAFLATFDCPKCVIKVIKSTTPKVIFHTNCPTWLIQVDPDWSRLVKYDQPHRVWVAHSFFAELYCPRVKKNYWGPGGLLVSKKFWGPFPPHWSRFKSV